MIGALPVTASLAIGAAIIWLLFGVAIGVLSALRRGSFFDRAAMSVALAGVSLPVFFTGLLSLAIFRDTIPLFPDAGNYIPITQNAAQVVRGAGAAVDHAGVPVRRAVRADRPGPACWRR